MNQKKEDELTHEGCKHLLKENNTPRHIFLHSRKVNGIAMLLASKLYAKGISVNRHLVDAGSLLHDIEKFNSLKNNEGGHGYAGYNTLIISQLPVCARIALKHGLDSVLDGKYGLTFWEDKLVYYADKRVNNDKIVSLDERFTYLRQRYGSACANALKRIESAFEPNMALEAEIFKNLDIKPEDITEDAVASFLIDDEYEGLQSAQ